MSEPVSQLHLQHNPLQGFLYSLVATFLLATNYITAKYGLEGFNPETFSIIWTLSATLFSFIIIIITHELKNITVPADSIKKITLLGFATGMGMILGWSGLARLDPSFASFLSRSRPVVTILLGIIFLKERFQKTEWIPAVIIIMGGFISATGRWDKIGVGMILILSSACLSAVQMLLAKMTIAKGRVSPNILVFYRVGIALATISIWNLLTCRTNFNVRISYYLVTILGAFLGPCLSWLFMYRSYRYWDLSRSSIVFTMQPLFVLPLAYFILGKLPVIKELYGGLIILIGSFWLIWIHIYHRKKTGNI
jgi:drug/metabolite transporter (DMT)-like permease